MTVKQQERPRVSWRLDWWLWPAAFLLALSGWGQVVWMWESVRPRGIAPWWLLLWTGVGVAGIAVALFWIARRWQLAAWLAIAAWAAAPVVYRMAAQPDPDVGAALERLQIFSPLVLLLLLGLGLSGVLVSLSGFAERRWSYLLPNTCALREGFWSGLFAATCGLLLINRLFNAVTAGLLAGALILIESYLVLREAPPEPAEPRKVPRAPRAK